MRRILLGLIGVMAVGASHAKETYSFTTLVNGVWLQQTLIHCTEPARMNGRVPERCILSEPATAYANTKIPRVYDFVCAAGHPIVFHPNGLLAYCKLSYEQALATHEPPGFAHCFGYATFDKDGIADCD